MNIFDKELNFRLAERKDINKIQNFYKEFWPYKTLVIQNEFFFIYEFGNQLKVNFLLVESKRNKLIESAVGFYQYSNESNEKHICGSLSLVRPKSKYPLIGVETLKRLKSITKSNSYCGTNTNSVTMLPLVKKFLSHHIGKMNHYYILNKKFNDFNIAIPDLTFKKDIKIGVRGLRLKSIHNLEELISTKILYSKFNYIPFKSLEYVIKKYMLNPIYKYSIYSINEDNIPQGLLITRLINAKDSKVIRIIDFIGDINLLPLLDYELAKLINEENLEYIDLVCNLKSELFEKSLFIDKALTASVIPHYFEPFVRENIEINYETNKKELYFFKGDGDGDRPNIR